MTSQPYLPGAALIAEATDTRMSQLHAASVVAFPDEEGVKNPGLLSCRAEQQHVAGSFEQLYPYPSTESCHSVCRTGWTLPTLRLFARSLCAGSREPDTGPVVDHQSSCALR